MFIMKSQPYILSQGVDEAYDAALNEYYSPYHHLVDLLMRVSVNNKHVTNDLVELSAMVAYEGASLHMQLFPKLWYEIYQSEDVDRRIIAMLTKSHSLTDYVDAVLEDERSSLNLPHVYQFFVNFFPRVSDYSLMQYSLLHSVSVLSLCFLCFELKYLPSYNFC